jgi:LuxR family transcriptional regulator, maltose regulon positive regulatory protein
MTTTVSGPLVSAPPQGITLLEDKLRIPRPGLAVLPRARIGALMDAAVSRRVTLMTGPPGAGKTVAAAQWAAGRPGSRRPGWVSIDAADSEPGRFWRYVTAALSKAGAMPGAKGGPPAGMTAAEFPLWISARVRSSSEAVVLVLDDVHLLAGTDSLAGLDELIRHEPAGLRLMLVGRSVPGLALSRLRLEGELADIGAPELACTAEETAAYFGMLGMPLGGAEQDHVRRQTEGWLAGLRLTALAGQAPQAAGAPAAAGAVSQASQAGAQALVADYLEDEVLSQLSPAVRSFMMRTSLTLTVSADLARDLTGETSAARLLENLSRETGLLQALAPDSGEYRYHPMLRDVLAVSLRRELPDEVPVLQRRVASWHAARGEVLPAVQAAAEVGEWDFGLQLLQEAGPVVMFSPAGPGLEMALASMPPGRIATDETLSGVLAVALAAARIWQGDADGALPHLERAESSFPALPADYRAETELWVMALRVMVIAAVATPEPGWLDQYWDRASHEHGDPRGISTRRALGTLWLALGFAALREFDTQLARSAFLHAGSQLSAGGLLALRERGRCWEAVASALYGDLAAATRLAGSVADGSHGRDEELAPVLALAAAAVSLARDEPESAGAMLDQADLAAMTSRPAGEPSIAVLSGLLRARLAVADGNLAGARGLVRWLSDAAATAGQAAGFTGVSRSRSEPAGAYPPAPPGPGRGQSRPRGAAAAVAVLDAEISLAAGELERARATLADLADAGQGAGAAAAPAGAYGANEFSPAAPASDASGSDASGSDASGSAAAGSVAPSLGAPGVEAAGLLAAVPARPDVAVCQARLAIADEDDKGALTLVEPVLADATGIATVADRIAALLAAVVARRRLSQGTEAAELLSEALALAEPEDACGPFVAAGSPVRSALTVLISPSSRSAGFAGRILDRFDGRLPRQASAQPAALLTDSELAVLRFLPSHMTNQEIAESLFLSINTIKTHLSSVYRKLGVANRRQAIAQGRRLELLLRAIASRAVRM